MREEAEGDSAVEAKEEEGEEEVDLVVKQVVEVLVLLQQEVQVSSL